MILNLTKPALKMFIYLIIYKRSINMSNFLIFCSSYIFSGFSIFNTELSVNYQNKICLEMKNFNKPNSNVYCILHVNCIPDLIALSTNFRPIPNYLYEKYHFFCLKF